MSAPKPLHSHTAPLTELQAGVLRGVLASEGFEFEERPYMLYFAKKAKLTVAVYAKGPKALIQGRGIEDFITLVLEPRMEKTPPKGMFKNGSTVRVWISQDERRLPVKFEVEFKIGTGVATLARYDAPPAAPTKDAQNPRP